MYTTILWDIDGTILDFSSAERHALKKSFKKFHLPKCTEEMVCTYSSINLRYWEMLERRELTKPEVLRGRFVEFFRVINLSVSDLSAFCSCYELHLADKIFFNDNALSLTAKLKELGVCQYAVTNGSFPVQSIKLKKSGLDRIFDDVFISDIVGYEKPAKEFFEYVLKKTGSPLSSETLIVGDSLTSDMQGGNNAGITCCWYNKNRLPNNSNLRIDYEIHNLWEVKKILNV